MISQHKAFRTVTLKMFNKFKKYFYKKSMKIKIVNNNRNVKGSTYVKQIKKRVNKSTDAGN